MPRITDLHRIPPLGCRIAVLALLAVTLFDRCSPSPSREEQGVIKFKVAHALTKNTHCHQGLEYFCQLLRERSNGVLQPTLYSGGELGDSRALLEGLQLGTVQIVSTAAAPLSAFDSRLMLCDLPFLFETHEEAEQILDGEIGRRIAADLPEKADMRLLSYWVSGFRSIFSSKGPVQSVEDLKELKIRVMETPVHIDAFKALGAIPTPMAFGELYTSLEQGVVDAAENDADAFFSQRFYEVCKHYSLTEHVYTAIPLTASEKFYQSLPEPLKSVLQQAADDARDYERRIAREMNEKALEQLKEAGVSIYPVDKAPFRRRMSQVYEKYAEQIGPDILSAVRGERETSLLQSAPQSG